MNLIDTWKLRPEAAIAIPNLFLASDYVRTNTDLATMEGANEAARRAVNGLLDAVEFNGDRCEIWPLHEPEFLAPWRLYDEERFRAGLPWDNSLTQVAAQAVRGASPVLELALPLLAAAAPYVRPVAAMLDPGDEPPGKAGNAAFRQSYRAAPLDPDAFVAGRSPRRRRCRPRRRRYRRPGRVPPAPRLVSRNDRRPAGGRRAVGGTEAAPLRAHQGFRRPIGQGFAPRAVHRDRCALSAAAPRARCRRPPVWKCSTTPFSCTTTSRMVATFVAGRPPCIAAPELPWRSTRVTP